MENNNNNKYMNEPYAILDIQTYINKEHISNTEAQDFTYLYADTKEIEIFYSLNC